MGSARVGSNPAVVANFGFGKGAEPVNVCAPLAEWSKALRSGRSLHSKAQVRILRGAVIVLRPHGSVGRALGC